MNKNIILLLCIFFQYSSLSAQNYKATYTFKLTPDSTNLTNTHTEEMYLLIKDNKESFCATKNFLKMDSIRSLLLNGTATFGEVIGTPQGAVSTRLKQLIHKEYKEKTIEVYESVQPEDFHYFLQDSIQWELTGDTATIAGYQCSKAITSYAGRWYTAWFTTELPIPDGPYIFNGLPGLIVKINDKKDQYSFTLERFERYFGDITEEPSFKKKAIKTTRSKVFSIREQDRKDPFYMMPGVIATQQEKEEVRRRMKRNNNPLELK
jgi:GLPGLI family protein